LEIHYPLSSLDNLNAGRPQKLIKRFDLGSSSAVSAVAEHNTLFGAGECDEEVSRALNLIASEAPPRAIVEPDEYDSVILKPFALMDGHERHGVQPLIGIQCESASNLDPTPLWLKSLWF
jgi:hypothetical protein